LVEGDETDFVGGGGSLGRPLVPGRVGRKASAFCFLLGLVRYCTGARNREASSGAHL